MDAPRDRFHPYLESHFICSDCQNVEEKFKALYDQITDRIDVLINEKDQLLACQSSKSRANDESFVEMPTCFDDIAATLSSKKHQKSS